MLLWWNITWFYLEALLNRSTQVLVHQSWGSWICAVRGKKAKGRSSQLCCDGRFFSLKGHFAVGRFLWGPSNKLAPERQDNRVSSFRIKSEHQMCKCKIQCLLCQLSVGPSFLDDVKSQKNIHKTVSVSQNVRMTSSPEKVVNQCVG